MKPGQHICCQSACPFDHSHKVTVTVFISLSSHQVAEVLGNVQSNSAILWDGRQICLVKLVAIKLIGVSVAIAPVVVVCLCPCACLCLSVKHAHVPFHASGRSVCVWHVVCLRVTWAGARLLAVNHNCIHSILILPHFIPACCSPSQVAPVQPRHPAVEGAGLMELSTGLPSVSSYLPSSLSKTNTHFTSTSACCSTSNASHPVSSGSGKARPAPLDRYGQHRITASAAVVG